MKKVTFPILFFLKTILPIICVIFMSAIGFVISIVFTEEVPSFFYAIIGVMALAEIVILRHILSKYIEEVWIDGTSLVVKNKGYEETIPFSNIKGIEAASSDAPAKIILKTPCRFGDKLHFFRTTGFKEIENFLQTQISNK